MELVEEYLNVVPHLTIPNEERNKIVIKTLKTENDKAMENVKDLNRKFASRIRHQNYEMSVMQRRLDELEKQKKSN